MSAFGAFAELREYPDREVIEQREHKSRWLAWTTAVTLLLVGGIFVPELARGPDLAMIITFAGILAVVAVLVYYIRSPRVVVRCLRLTLRASELRVQRLGTAERQPRDEHVPRAAIRAVESRKIEWQVQGLDSTQPTMGNRITIDKEGEVVEVVLDGDRRVAVNDPKENLLIDAPRLKKRIAAWLAQGGAAPG